MENPPDMKPRDDRAQTRADLLRLLDLYRPYWRWMLGGILLSLITVLANVGLMAVAGWFIAAMALAGVAGVAMNYFTPAALIRLFAILRTGGRYLERLVTHEATFRLLAELRVWFYIKLEPLVPARLGTLRGSDLLNRIQADIESLNHVYLSVLVPVTVGLLAGVIIVGALACYSLPVALTTLLFLLGAGALLPAFLLKKGEAPGRDAIAQRAALREQVIDDLQGLAELQVYGAVPGRLESAERRSRALIGAQTTLSRLTGFSQGTQILCATFALWTALLLVLPRLHQGALPAPDVAMLALFVLASFEAVLPLPAALQMLGQSLAAARRIFSLIDRHPALRDPTEPATIPAAPDLCLRGVRLRYQDDGPWALDGVDLDLPHGRRLAVVGASGAGKSSLVNLLLRFWDYQDGEIRFGGQRLDAYRGADLRAHIAVVSQDPYLFNASIRENLCIARPDADPAALEAACRAARLHDFITGLPDGYDTLIGEAGARLSGGQARRLAIARALLLDAPLVILDEPTEGLDTITEGEVLESLDTLMEGRSVLLISHRLGALAGFVDRALVLEQGRVVQEGTPAALATQDGPYRHLNDALETAAG